MICTLIRINPILYILYTVYYIYYYIYAIYLEFFPGRTKFVEKLVAKAKALKAGQAPGEIGPIIDPAALQRIERYVAEAEPMLDVEGAVESIESKFMAFLREIF